MSHNSLNRLKFIFFTFLFSLLLVSVLTDEEDDWGWDDEDDSATGQSGSAPQKLKRWNKEGICDHDPMTSMILKLILEIQGSMQHGDPASGIPPLDPLSIPKMSNDLTGTKHDYRVKANITNILVRDLSTFTIKNIESDLGQMSANLSIAIDAMVVNGDYDLKGKARMGILQVPVWGNGRFTLKPKGASCDFFSKFGYNKNDTLILEHFDFALHLDEIGVQFTGFMGVGRMVSSRLFDKLLNSVGVKLFRKVEPKIHEKIRARTIQEINRMLIELEFNEQMVEEMIQQSVYCMFG